MAIPPAQKVRVRGVTYQEALLMSKLLAGQGFFPLNYRNPRTWWNKGPTRELTAAIRAWQSSIGAKVDGTMNAATRGQVGYILKTLQGKNPSGADAETRKVIIENYGPGMASYLTHWELGPLLVEAAKNGWSQQILQGKLENTYWWHHTTAAVRNWDKLALEDPGEMAAQFERKIHTVDNMALNMGVKLSKTQLWTVTHDALRYGWEDERIQQIVGGYFKMGVKGRQTGAIDKVAQDIITKSREYFAVVPRDTAYKYAQKVVSGQMTEDGMEAMWIAQAKARFPSLAKLIQEGMKPSDYFAGHQQAIAATLEMSPEEIDLVNDRRWKPVLEVQDGKTRRPMTVGEAERWARGTKTYQTTRKANEEASTVVATLGNLMGQTKI